jgi:hypothetical protein
MSAYLFLRHISPPTAIRSFSSCPFQILGLKSVHHHQSSRAPLKSASVTYSQVQAAFRKLALVHHPDTANKGTKDGDDSKRNDSREFTRIREAFEAIVEGPGGMAVLRENKLYESISSSQSKDDIKSTNESFHETNKAFLHPSLNPSILREVAEVADMSPGGLDKGGMWEYAKSIRNMAQEEGLPPLHVEGGENDQRRTGRRRRKK